MAVAQDACNICSKKFKDGEEIIPVLRWIISDHRGSWATSQGHRFIHASHIKKESS